jgi:acyl carrier protein
MMEKNDFLNSFQEQFEDTDASEITFETVYKDLPEWNSMMALVIIAFVDEKYEITVTGADLQNTRTVEDLYNIVLSKK